MKKLALLVSCVVLLCACEKAHNKSGDYFDPSGDVYSGEEGDGGIPNSGSGEGEKPQEYAGRVTAGEWRDLDNWLFWSNLMTNQQSDQQGNNYTQFSEYWGFYTNNRVAVRVTNENGDPQKDVSIQLVAGTNVLYEARTNNHGETNLWVGLTQLQQTVDTSSLALVVNGETTEQAVLVTHWGEKVQWNICTTSATDVNNIDIAFIVDATGSMMDEIDFLKADLLDIINIAHGKHAASQMRTSAIFYRDEGDEYVTRVNNFSTDIAVTTSFIANQTADGGGDYPEAVHTALEKGLQNLSWSESNSIRLAFMLLDAPPHKQADVIASLQKSIPLYAKKGIRIIPVAASGVDKPTEFFLRFAAIATDGTYVFITNDSGVGNEHIQATVGDYQVELLKDLIVRLIDQYMQ